MFLIYSACNAAVRIFDLKLAKKMLKSVLIIVPCIQKLTTNLTVSLSEQKIYWFLSLFYLMNIYTVKMCIYHARIKNENHLLW